MRFRDERRHFPWPSQAPAPRPGGLGHTIPAHYPESGASQRALASAPSCPALARWDPLGDPAGVVVPTPTRLKMSKSGLAGASASRSGARAEVRPAVASHFGAELAPIAPHRTKPCSPWVSGRSPAPALLSKPRQCVCIPPASPLAVTRRGRHGRVSQAEPGLLSPPRNGPRTQPWPVPAGHPTQGGETGALSHARRPPEELALAGGSGSTPEPRDGPAAALTGGSAIPSPHAHSDSLCDCVTLPMFLFFMSQKIILLLLGHGGHGVKRRRAGIEALLGSPASPGPGTPQTP